MVAEKERFDSDMRLITTFFEEELEESEELCTILEDTSLYWIDDLVYVINVITKRLFMATHSSIPQHPVVFLKEDDKDYAIKLLDSAMANYSEYFDLLSKYLENWDRDRLATTDIILIIMGLAEAISFPNIPIKVSINEYVELSKYYSTPNSRIFVNGMLDRMLISLQEEGRIEKSGRGLVGS